MRADTIGVAPCTPTPISTWHPAALVADRPSIGLAEVMAGAPALTRVDRKYVLPHATVAALLTGLDDDWRVLAVDGRRATHYSSTYLDTPDLRSVREHVQGRRRRWKARTRLYVEDGLRRVEVKVRDGRGRTVKTQAESAAGPGVGRGTGPGTGPGTAAGTLPGPDRDFVVRALASHGLAVDAATLGPTATVTYARTTLVHLGEQPMRLTVDADLRCTLAGRELWLDAGHVVVETKGDLRPGEPDRLLRDLGRRPRPFSKYAAAGALLRTDIPDNDVRRLLGHVLHTHHPRPDHLPSRSRTP